MRNNQHADAVEHRGSENGDENGELERQLKGLQARERVANQGLRGGTALGEPVESLGSTSESMKRV